MKKILSVILSFTMAVSLLAGLTITASAASDLWDGHTTTEVYETAKDGSAGFGCYLIDTAEKLAWVASQVNSGEDSFSGETILLASDIDLGGMEWTPIGSYAYPFRGTFDGGGHTISNLSISNNWQYEGLFGYCEGAVIENVTVSGAIELSGSSSDFRTIGGIAAYMHDSGCKISNCESNIDISGSIGPNTDSSVVGGVAGGTYGTISGCTNNGTISVTINGGSENLVGGVVGSAGGDYLYDCYNYGSVGMENVDEGSTSDIGGIAGGVSSDAWNCFNSGAVTFSGPSTDVYAGGVFGSAGGYGISNCYNTGSVTGPSDTSSITGTLYFGGIAGYISSGLTAENLANTGTVDEKTAKYFSGAVIGGNNVTSPSVGNCYWGGSCTLTAACGSGITVSNCSGFDAFLAFPGGSPVDVGSDPYTNALEALNAWVGQAHPASGESVYRPWTGATSSALGFGEIVSADYDVSAALTNITVSSGSIGAGAASYGSQYLLTLKADFGYILPHSIAVSVGSEELVPDTGYSWDGGCGDLVIDASYITGDISITAAAVRHLPRRVQIGGLTLYSTTADDIYGEVTSDSGIYTLDCSEIEDGSGTAVYDSGTGTLTLNSAVVPSTSDIYNKTGIYTEDGDLTLALNGDSVFGVAGNSNTISDYYIANGSLTVKDGPNSGTGSLTAYSYNTSGMVCGLRADNDLYFKSGSYVFIGSGDAIAEFGIRGGKGLCMDGGSVDISITSSGDITGVCSWGGMYLKGGTMNVNVSGPDAVGIFSSKSFVISGGAVTVTASDSGAVGICAEAPLIVSGGTVIATGSLSAFTAVAVTYNGSNTISNNTAPAILEASTADGEVTDLRTLTFDYSRKSYFDGSGNLIKYIKIGSKPEPVIIDIAGGLPAYSAEISKGNDSGTSLPIIVNKDSGNASVSFSQELSSSGTVITAPSISGIDSYSLNIPVSNLSTSGRRGTVSLNTGAGSVTLPSNMLTGVAGIDGSTAEVTIGEGNKNNLPDDVRAAIGDRPLIRLTLSIDGSQTNWSNPDAPVTVAIPYTPTAEELANPESIVVWYIDGSGDAVTIPNGHYDPVTKTVIVAPTHFSLYAVGCNDVAFSDVEETAWYYDAVSFIAAREISSGTGENKFSPDAALTRGQFITLLMRAYEIDPDNNTADNFTDAGDTYYTGYLAAAKRLNISNGMGDNKFAPEQDITRQEMFTLLYKALTTVNQLPEEQSLKELSEFSDGGSISAYAREAMSYLVKAGTISGNDGRLLPEASATRAEMAQILYNLLSK